ncbi:hypothetical protein PCYB_003890, partial [Plasmodium cynomolgi strain B]
KSSESELQDKRYIKQNIRCTCLNIWLHFYTKIRCVPVDFMQKFINAINAGEYKLPESDNYKKCLLESYDAADNTIHENVTKLSIPVNSYRYILDILFKKPSSSTNLV